MPVSEVPLGTASTPSPILQPPLTPSLLIDIVHLICSFLHNDLGTLYSLSLACRLYSTIALPALYTSLTTFPSNDDEDRLQPESLQTSARLRKWSSLWRSLALSALDPQRTFLPYARHLRVLDLRDLLSLMDELRPSRMAPWRKAFFADGLEECEKVRVFASGTYFDFNLSTDFLADIITKGTRNAVALIRETPERPTAEEQGEGHLARWLLNLPHLEFLQVFSAEVFEDERVRDALTQCPKLRSLTIYLWSQAAALGEATAEDSALSQLLSSAGQGVGLERFVMEHGTRTFGQLSISALSHFHGRTLVELEILDISTSALTQLSLASNVTQLRICTLSYDSHITPEIDNIENYIKTLSSFLSSNASLQILDIRVPNMEAVLKSSLQNLHLHTLRLTELIKPRVESLFGPDFWKAISTQSSSLQELYLPPPLVSENSLVEFSDLPGDMMTAVCSLPKLRTLEARGFTRYITDEDVYNVVINCRELRQLMLTSPLLTDAALMSLSGLPELREFLAQYAAPYLHA